MLKAVGANGGDGIVKIEMQFLPDVYVECESAWQRYNNQAFKFIIKVRISLMFRYAVPRRKWNRPADH
jgi:excinuclease UvrABC ATPase subunit